MTLATPERAAEVAKSTIKTYLRPIDRDGLLAFGEKGRNNPNTRGTNKVHTVVDGKFRTLSYVGNHTPWWWLTSRRTCSAKTPHRLLAKSFCPAWVLPERWYYGRSNVSTSS